MAVILPTFSLTSNASTASINAGPLSIALSLTAEDTLTVDSVTAEVVSVGTTETTLIDGSAQDAGSEVAGTNGGFIYMKNVSAGDHDVYIGIEADSASATDLSADADTKRLFTLKQDEFAFFPFDYTMDITVDGEDATCKLEFFLFNRG